MTAGSSHPNGHGVYAVLPTLYWGTVSLHCIGARCLYAVLGHGVSTLYWGTVSSLYWGTVSLRCIGARRLRCTGARCLYTVLGHGVSTLYWGTVSVRCIRARCLCAVLGRPGERGKALISPGKSCVERRGSGHKAR